jgi:CheY-like chemotaxis protein
MAKTGHSRASVLVVDDDRDSREVLQAILQLDGHDVRCAEDGPAALAVASEFVPDVIFLDINMPKMNGYVVCDRMRAMRQLDATRIIALSALRGEAHNKLCTEVGFDEQISKPLDVDRVTELLSRRTH